MEELSISNGSSAIAAFAEQKQNLVRKSAQIAAIQNEQDFNSAAEARKEIAQLVKEVSAQRKAITVKLDTAKKNIISQEKEMTAELVSEDERLKALLNFYATEQMRIRNAQEMQRMKAESDAAMRNAEAAELGIDAVFTANTDADAVTAKPKGTLVYKFEVIAPAEVPRDLCSPDEGAIRAFVQYQKSMKKPAESIVIPGVRVWSEMRVDNR